MKACTTSEPYAAARSLFQLWWQGRRLPISWFNLLTCVVTAVAAFVYARHPATDQGALIDVTRSMAVDGIVFSGTLLGFLLAGFSVFASLANREFFHIVARVPYKKTPFSCLQFSFMIFVEAMANCLIFLVGCTLIRLLSFSKGPISSLVGLHPDLRSGVVIAGFTLMATATVFLLLTLKSFIFNIYAMVHVELAVGYELGQAPAWLYPDGKAPSPTPGSSSNDQANP